jgi:hypothetical protein
MKRDWVFDVIAAIEIAVALLTGYGIFVILRP